MTKRLKLARVAPALLEAYRDGDMSLEELQAFTVSDDHGQQVEVWQTLKQRPYSRYPHDIRRLLINERL